MSSIVDIRLKEGRRDKIRTSLDLNIAGLGGTVEGPLFEKRGSWILSLRRNYHDVLSEIIGYGVAPRFGDVHFKLVYDLDSRNEITLLNIYGDSRLSYNLETALDRGYNSFLDFQSSQNTIGLNWFSMWSRRCYSNTSLSYSFFKLSNDITHVTQDSAYLTLRELSGAFHFRNLNYFQFTDTIHLEFGGEAKHEHIDSDDFLRHYTNRLSVKIPDLIRNDRVTVTKGGMFSTLYWNSWNRLLVSLGVRCDFFSYSRRFYLSPRLSLALKLNSRLSLQGAFGVFRQTVPLHILAGSPENRENDDPFATHYLLGLEYDFSEFTSLRLDVYDKEYRNLALSSEDFALSIMDSGLEYNRYLSGGPLADSGKAYSRGIEILFKKRTMEGLYGTVCLALFRFRYRDFSGEWRDRINDNRYRWTMVGGYKLNDMWSVSLRWELAGGVPYTPFDIEASREINGRIIDQNQINSVRYPPFHSLTLQIDREFNFDRSSLTLYISVQNILNRKNVDRYYWDIINNDIGTLYQSSILPLFGVRYSF